MFKQYRVPVGQFDITPTITVWRGHHKSILCHPTLHPTTKKRKRKQNSPNFDVMQFNLIFSDPLDKQHLHAGHQPDITPSFAIIWRGYLYDDFTKSPSLTNGRKKNKVKKS